MYRSTAEHLNTITYLFRCLLHAKISGHFNIDDINNDAKHSLPWGVRGWEGGRTSPWDPQTPWPRPRVAHKQTNSYLYINLFGMFNIFLLENQLWTAALFKERYKWFHKLTKLMMQHWDDIITVWLDTQSIVMKLPLVILVLCLGWKLSIDCISGSPTKYFSFIFSLPAFLPKKKIILHFLIWSVGHHQCYTNWYPAPHPSYIQTFMALQTF